MAPQLDSGVMHLLRKCPVPVWVMRPSRARKLRILALVDPDSSDPVRDGLNNLVLRLAMSLASREGGELHVGHAWSLEFESTLRLSPYLKLPRAEVDTMVREAEADHREQLEALVARHHVREWGAQSTCCQATRARHCLVWRVGSVSVSSSWAPWPAPD